MADPKHLAILKQGVAVWNHWRIHNPQIKPNLKGADLRSAILRLSTLKGVNLSQTNLTETDLKGADLWYANLMGADLRGADLRGANLWGADLSQTQLLGVNFQGAILTGVCILDGRIDNQTNFNDVLCRFIYRQANQQERLPLDPNLSLASGDFAHWIQTR
ncbi:MAG: pentapeptide repeat-containing protein [Limnoraphis robusta]|uniref:Pentapeptide repeat-containing protein n=1 Tax=Limnoraphis robusta CCNP1315 TaxID=3110306 RepID=A0ABU5TUM1_9CYAN|nr:pentapeptide repeat-containing protein [Limnoraphis robusta]MEA5499825.1 pentapeptide repeat-containing protein [Limnoraphis robusta BA-68 BA1]MEA5518597.1 pentapeptide repeat-containing protein [Limnoraphis robusta CCNP1315]MEA5538673.1 pentapeptide repeat-containing protein [Limnoraphis robusta Tam1]MEA5548008.1 pentapeptide repeat-containing protein [Limnoraphis robusta CCNP1324]